MFKEKLAWLATSFGLAFAYGAVIAVLMYPVLTAGWRLS